MADAIANGFTVLHQRSDQTLHGERAAFGAIVQLFLEGRPTAEINALIDFCRQIRLPTSLGDLKLDDTRRDTLWPVAEAVCATSFGDARSPFLITPELVLDAIIAADVYSQGYASVWEHHSDYAPVRSDGQSVLA